jgi:hypothetical protein
VCTSGECIRYQYNEKSERGFKRKRRWKYHNGCRNIKQYRKCYADQRTYLERNADFEQYCRMDADQQQLLFAQHDDDHERIHLYTVNHQ